LLLRWGSNCSLEMATVTRFPSLVGHAINAPSSLIRLAKHAS